MKTDLQFTDATPEDDNKYKHNSESETNSPYIVVGTFEGLCPSNTFAGLPDTPSLEGALKYQCGQKYGKQRCPLPRLSACWGPWGPSLPLPRKGFTAETQRLPHKRKHKTTRPQSLPMQRMPMRKLRRKRMTSMWRRRGKDASPFDTASCIDEDIRRASWTKRQCLMCFRGIMPYRRLNGSAGSGGSVIHGTYMIWTPCMLRVHGRVLILFTEPWTSLTQSKLYIMTKQTANKQNKQNKQNKLHRTSKLSKQLYQPNKQ